MRCVAVLFACLVVPVSVEAKPSTLPMDRFEGDRYSARAVAQPARRAVTQRAAPVRYSAKARYYYRVKKIAPVSRRKPPRAIAPMTLADGLRGEIAVAAGLPESIGSTRRGVVLGGRPAGCPSRFCGCGASIHLFGRIIPSLNLAANWLRFPRTAPSPNMVAARRGHVFVLKRHIAGNTWLVHDSNSGGRRTRLHHRSIAGYVIVNPHGAVTEMSARRRRA
jgi:hypothetical protein